MRLESQFLGSLLQQLSGKCQGPSQNSQQYPCRGWEPGGRSWCVTGRRQLQTVSGPSRPPAILSSGAPGPYLAVEEAVEHRHEETLGRRGRRVKGLGQARPHPAPELPPFCPQTPALPDPTWENPHPKRSRGRAGGQAGAGRLGKGWVPGKIPGRS